jgi:hypothetical protein
MSVAEIISSTAHTNAFLLWEYAATQTVMPIFQSAGRGSGYIFQGRGFPDFRGKGLIIPPSLWKRKLTHYQFHRKIAGGAILGYNS